MTLAEQALHGREFTTIATPFSVYCYKCNVTIQKGSLSLRFDAATYVHETCPTTPHKTFAAHKYGDAR